MAVECSEGKYIFSCESVIRLNDGDDGVLLESMHGLRASVCLKSVMQCSFCMCFSLLALIPRSKAHGMKTKVLSSSVVFKVDFCAGFVSCF